MTSNYYVFHALAVWHICAPITVHRNGDWFLVRGAGARRIPAPPMAAIDAVNVSKHFGAVLDAACDRLSAASTTKHKEPNT